MRPIAAVAAVLVTCVSASAEIVLPVHDTDLIGCDLVVVAKIERGNMMKGAAGQTDIKLLVTETLRGQAPGEIIDVRVYAPLVVGGGRMLLADRNWGTPAELVDLAENAIWFLRKSKDETHYVVRRAQYAQPMALKPYFVALLSRDPEAAALKLLGRGGKTVKLRVMDYLAARHRPRDARPIAALLADGDADVQARAADTAAKVGDVSAVAIFRKALTHANPSVRAAACVFLCRFRDTVSIFAIGRAVAGMPPLCRGRVASNMWRMGSWRVVDLLLAMLDEHLGPQARPDLAAYQASRQAAESLRRLTGVHFPLDAARARLRWQAVKPLGREVLLRKAVLSDIEELAHADYNVRWNAYRDLHRAVNRHFGSFNAFHGREHTEKRAESQRLWHEWADKNLLGSRHSWVRDGFGAAGIHLPDPMTKAGIDTVIEVLMYYSARGRSTAAGPPRWKVLGWPQADCYRYNANWLLEYYTGHRVGLCPYSHDLPWSTRADSVLENRWVVWWRANREKTALGPRPAEPGVSRQQVEEAPAIGAIPPPLKVTIRPGKLNYRKTERVAIDVEVRNISTESITLVRRPGQIRYSSRTGSGSGGSSTGSGQNKRDFVTLEAGQTLTWTENGAAFGGYTKPHRVENFHYRLVYPYAGSQFGLRAWRGELLSNDVSYAVAD